MNKAVSSVLRVIESEAETITQITRSSRERVDVSDDDIINIALCVSKIESARKSIVALMNTVSKLGDCNND